MAFSKGTSAGYLANHMARLFALGLQERIRPLGITPGQFPALLELWETDGLTQKELVRRLDIEQATMANTLARMERDGLVVRRPHPADARAQQVWLTDKGRRLRTPALRAAAAQNAQALAGFDAAESDRFVSLMARAIAAMQAARDVGRDDGRDDGAR
ncbi:MAG: MarR family transcriptional regulator [Alphaproteobacteria bacterium]